MLQNLKKVLENENKPKKEIIASNAVKVVNNFLCLNDFLFQTIIFINISAYLHFDMELTFLLNQLIEAIKISYMHFFRGLKLACTYFPRQFLHCTFSTAEQNAKYLKPLSDSAQKAIWAQHVIRSIINLPPATSIKDKSLREKIIELKLQNTGYQLSAENRLEVLKMFKEGIQINMDVYDQSRVQKAIKTIIKPTKKGPLIFCPNYSVTRQIFEILNSPFSSNSMITGGYGISKTIGIIMFSQLVLFKSKFMMEAKNDTVKKKEMENLSDEKLIQIKNISKCWYWSIDQEKLLTFQEQKEYQFIRKLLLTQATELSKQQIRQFQKIDNYKQFIKKFKSTYRKADIPQLVIFDQINSVASRMRQVNSIIYQREKIIDELKDWYRKRTFKDENQKKKIYRELDDIQKTYRQKIKQKHSTYKDVEYMLKYIDQLKKYGKAYRFNSSITFQRDYLNKQEFLPKDMLCFNIIGGHKQFFFHQIDYHQTLLTNRGKIDFYHFFWFQIMRLLLDANVSVENVQKIKEQIYKSFQKSIKVKSYYRIIFINQIFEEYAAKIKTINQETSLQTILKLFNEIVINFDKQCLLKIEKNLIKFMLKKKDAVQKADNKNHKQTMKQIEQNLNKELQQKVDIQQKEQLQPLYVSLIKLLYELAENDIKVGNKQMNYQKSDLQELMGSNIVPLVTAKTHDRQALPVQVGQKKINFLWDPEQFMQMVKRIVDPIKQDFYSEFWSKNFLERCKQNRSTLGTSIQSAFIQVLIPRTIIQFFTFSHGEKMKQQHSAEHYSKLQIQIFEKSDYLTLRKDSDFFKNMEKILQWSKKNPGKWFYGQPSKEVKNLKPYDQSQQQKPVQEKIVEIIVEHDNLSPSIDFLFVRFDQERQIHQIQSFDMSVGFNLTTKRNQFKQLFNEIVQKTVNIEGMKLSITHNILCHEDEMRPAEQIKLPLQKPLQKKKSPETFLIDNKIRVCFSSLDQIKVMRCFKSTAQKSFKYLHRWLCKNREKNIILNALNAYNKSQKSPPQEQNNQKKK